MTDRDPPHQRSHSTYKAENWDILDIDSVDRVYAVESPSDDSNPPRVRLDIDGFASSSSMRTLSTKDANVNTSIWLTLPDGRDLAEQLEEVVGSVSDENQRTVQCSDCLTELDVPDNVAVLKCRVCDGLIPIDDRAAELLAEGIGSQWSEASKK